MSKEVSNIKTIIGKMTEDVSKEEVVQTPESAKNVPTLGFVGDGVMGSTTTEINDEKIEDVILVENFPITKVALFSTRNMYAEGGPGKLNIGYNIVSKKHVDFWLSLRGVRLATPEEVAEAFR